MFIQTWTKAIANLKKINITCSTSFIDAIVIVTTVMVSNDNDADHGQRRPWLRWSWSSNVEWGRADGNHCATNSRPALLAHSLLTSSLSAPLTPLPASHLSQVMARPAQLLNLYVWPVDIIGRYQPPAICYPCEYFLKTTTVAVHCWSPIQFNGLKVRGGISRKS